MRVAWGLAALLAGLVLVGPATSAHRACEHETDRTDSRPLWAPDGTRLAYVRDDGFDTAGLLHVAVHTVALDGSGDATITPSLEFADQPFWSR